MKRKYVTIGLLSILYRCLKKKIAKNFEEMVLLMGNLPIFASLYLQIRLFIYVSRHDCVFNIAGF